ncbi:hypothetical protein ABYF32_00270 [Buchananella felis]|uniref:hypothetical protein n=1 Tax=Buchananella felis TaxID=3231492 RepID=UPI003526E75B
MRKVMAAVMAGALALGLAACGESAANKGQDTTCGDYLKMDTAQQIEVLKKGAEQAGEVLDGTEEDMKLYASLLADMCKEADANTKIKDL